VVQVLLHRLGSVVHIRLDDFLASQTVLICKANGGAQVAQLTFKQIAIACFRYGVVTPETVSKNFPDYLHNLAAFLGQQRKALDFNR
jgi:hypothetical protein